MDGNAFGRCRGGFGRRDSVPHQVTFAESDAHQVRDERTMLGWQQGTFSMLCLRGGFSRGCQALSAKVTYHRNREDYHVP
jgi:hypothetical protein